MKGTYWYRDRAGFVTRLLFVLGGLRWSPFHFSFQRGRGEVYPNQEVYMRETRKRGSLESWLRWREKQLRQRANCYERWVCNALKELNLKFKWQHGVTLGDEGAAILDFWIPGEKIDLEIDGERHKKNPERDKIRDYRLRKYHGIKVVRLSNTWVRIHKENLAGDLEPYLTRKGWMEP